ncbi:diguanylate cyclase [Arhodomonas sp. SL1]|uniref:sensor domain-containing diguanylate cyclase n=1 Tax=Arhodomonas sp. SL1 TaxID=3425691 RepID=UPI003F885E3A
MPEPDDRLAAALADCAREPVHIPGAIQSAGWLVCLDGELGGIRQASANLAQWLGVAPEQALGMESADVFGRRLREWLRRGLGPEGSPAVQRYWHRPSPGPRMAFHLTAYRTGDRVVVEGEPVPRQPRRTLQGAFSRELAALTEAPTVSALLQRLTEGVRAITDHERVLVYRFDSDWNGAVIAEDLEEGMAGFRGHHFPATDIPPQVRRIYGINPVRSIPDATAPAVPLLGVGGSPEEPSVDLSRGVLRAVSPVHLAYLRNMGVASAFSVALHGDEGLWGLLAGHGSDPRVLPPPVREAVVALTRAAAQRLFLLREREAGRFRRAVHDSRDSLVGAGEHVEDPASLLRRYGERWRGLFDADGIALVVGEQPLSQGHAPAPAQLLAITRLLGRRMPAEERAWASRELAAGPLGEAVWDSGVCGALVVRLPLEEGDAGWLMFFRGEEVESRRWAGDPHKPAVGEVGESGLGPRHSFATWVERLHGRSRPWTEAQRRAAIDLGEDLAVAATLQRARELNRRLARQRAELEAANERLEHLAHTDPLTQVRNRYGTELAIDAAISGAERYGRRLSLLLFDVDHFKQFNDRAGHEAGDRVLAGIASEVAGSLRRSDDIGRWGGEEFIVIASGIGHDAALCLADRLRQRIATMEPGGQGEVTISVGVATWRRGDDRRQLVARADRAMYAAKCAGRNRVASDQQ